MNVRPISEDDLQAYVDGALDPARESQVAAYLASHSEAARRVESYRRQRDALREAFAPVADEPLPAELNLARMIEGRRPRIALWRTAAAAALVLCIGGVGGWSLHAVLGPEREGVAALAQEVADNYQVFAPDRLRPIELAADDKATLVAWAEQRLGRRLPVPDLSAAGYRFVGGRLTVTPHGPAVLYLYDDERGNRLVMLSRNMKVDRNTERMERHSRGSVESFVWADRGIGYSLAALLPPEVLHPLADEVRRQVGEGI